MGIIKRLINKSKMVYYTSSSARYIKFLRDKGVKVGEGCVFRNLKTTRIDITRPSLVEIGNNVDMNHNFQILTHDWASHVFINYYHELIPSSGKVKIGSNIYFGTDVIVLKGVTIGDNCLIAAGSIITKDIPANSVAAGAPAKVICTLEEYYEKRKSACIEEAFEYARSIKERFNRRPVISDFWEEFPLFVEGEEPLFDKQLIINQLGGAKISISGSSSIKRALKVLMNFLKQQEYKRNNILC